MAAGSAQARKDRLLLAGYATHRDRRRCDNCVECTIAGYAQKTRYDRLCVRYQAIVKTHGGCAMWRAKS